VRSAEPTGQFVTNRGFMGQGTPWKGVPRGHWRGVSAPNSGTGPPHTVHHVPLVVCRPHVWSPFSSPRLLGEGLPCPSNPILWARPGSSHYPRQSGARSSTFFLYDPNVNTPQ